MLFSGEAKQMNLKQLREKLQNMREEVCLSFKMHVSVKKCDL